MEKSSLTCKEMAAQLAVLRRRNEELADQVKRLVATEHKLYETQEANDSKMHIYRQLHEYGKKFNTCFDIDEIFRLTLKFVLYELNFSCALVFLYEQHTDSFYLHMMDGFYDEDSQGKLKNIRLPLSNPAIEPLHAGAERIICANDCGDEALLELGRRLLLAEYQVNLLAGTIHSPFALLFVGNRKQDKAFSTPIEKEGDMMIGLANLVAQVFTSIQNISWPTN
jgi:hypothetical protein